MISTNNQPEILWFGKIHFSTNLKQFPESNGADD